MFGFMTALAMVVASFVGYTLPSPTVQHVATEDVPTVTASATVPAAVPYLVVRCAGPDGYGFTYAGTDGGVINSGACRPAVFNVVCDGPSAYGVSWFVAEQWAASVGTCRTEEVR